MSAIFGAISLHGKVINETNIEKMKISLQNCAIDKFCECKTDFAYMACGIQFFTPEASREELPLSFENKLFTADVVLDNRSELLEKLNISPEEGRFIADGAILFQLYHKYRGTCLNWILGAYTFAYFDYDKQQLELVTDAVGSRSLYYTIENDIFYFSSLMETLTSIQSKCEWNSVWISDFLGMKHLGILNHAESTIYENISYLPKTTQLIYEKSKKLTKYIYWNPLKHKKELKFLKDEDCKKIFQKLFSDCVCSTLRSVDQTAVLLSAGLDSTAVACIAAPFLQKQNKKLFAYTSVPEKDYQEDKESGYLENETEYILKTKEFLGNLECTFVDLPGKNAWDNRLELMNFYEMPYKSVQNVVWLSEISKLAAKDGNKILLTGSSGNGAFSFGSITMLMNSLFQRGHFREYFEELQILQSFGNSRKSILINNSRKALARVFYRRNHNQKSIRESFVSEKAVQKYRLESRFKQKGYATESYNIKDFRKGMLAELPFRQVAEFETKQSLRTGILLRDPTRDKRLLEFCIQLPERHFAWGGIERRLVVEYLADVLPDFINMKHKRGLQSADIMLRLEKQWDRISKEMEDVFLKYQDNFFVDCNKALTELKKLKKGSLNTAGFDVYQLIYTAMMLEFMNKH